MKIAFNWIAPLVAVALMAIVAGQIARADDSATSQPSAGSDSITVTVLDSNNKPVDNARVRLYAGKKKASGKAAAMATGQTNSDGVYTFNGLVSGDYRISVLSTTIGKGKGKATLSDDEPNAKVSITLASDNGAPTTSPSSN